MSKNNYISITAVGDLMFGDSPKCVGIGVRSMANKNGCEYILRDAHKLLTGDIVFGNLECVISDNIYKQNNFVYGQMIGSSQIGGALKQAGFNVVSIANNHIMQFGRDGVVDTKQCLENNSMSVAGLCDDAHISIPVTCKIDSKTVTMLAFSLVSEKYSSSKPCYAKVNENKVLDQVSEYRSKCDILILSLHWGDEFVELPSSETVEFAHRLVDLGANIIIGHHPHVIQPVEIYKKSVIAYSLGNFVSDMNWDATLREGLILNLRIYDNKPPAVTMWKASNNEKYQVFLKGEISNDMPRQTPIAMNEYKARVEELRVRNRNLSHVYLFKNIFKYNPVTFSQILLNSFFSFLGVGGG